MAAGGGGARSDAEALTTNNSTPPMINAANRTSTPTASAKTGSDGTPLAGFGMATGVSRGGAAVGTTTTREGIGAGVPTPVRGVLWEGAPRSLAAEGALCGRAPQSLAV